MKGDLSRIAFDERRYARVVAQQGRVQLDADWNEQQALIDYRLRTMSADVFGHGGLLGFAVAPRSHAGFGLHVHRGGVLDGTDAPLTIPAAGSFTHDGANDRAAFSIAFWLKPAVVPNDAKDAPDRIVVARSDANGGGEFTIAIDRRNRVVFSRDGATKPERVVSSSALERDRFGHAVCVFSGDAMEIWIDGALDTRVASRAPSAALPDAPIVLGPAAASPFALGELEWVGIWRMRLLREDVTAGFMQRPLWSRPALAWAFEDARRAPGAPHAGRAFLCAAPGRVYVGGRMCEQFEHRALGASEGLPTEPGSGIHALVDVWDQYVSAFEEPAIADYALGGSDTAGRIRTAARVRFLTGAREEIRDAYASYEDRGAIAVGLGAEPPDDNALYRFEVHASGGAIVADEAEEPALAATLVLADGDAARGIITIEGQRAPLQSGTFLAIDGTRDDDSGRAKTIRVLGPEPSGSENPHRYAVVEIPNGQQLALRVRPAASMLWSRENAYGVFLIDEIIPDASNGTTRITLKDRANRGRYLSDARGNVVAITDPARTANGEPGMLTAIVAIDLDHPDMAHVVVDGIVAGFGAGATLRTWDGVLAVDSGSTKPIDAGNLTVRFGSVGQYRSGDYWSALVRPDAPLRDRLAWPTDDDGSVGGAPRYAPPDGINHTFALIGEVAVDENGEPRVVADHRILLDAPGDAILQEMLASHETPDDPLPDGEPSRDAEPEREPEPVVAEVKPPVAADPPRAVPWPEAALLVARFELDGFVATGSVLDAFVERPEWSYLGPAPATGPTQLVACAGSLYALFTDGTFATYDPRSPEGTWRRLRRFEGTRTQATLAAVDDAIYVVGGCDARGRPSAEIDVYDRRHDAWTVRVVPLRTARIAPFAAAGRGNTLLVGGGFRRSWFGQRYASRSMDRYHAESERSASAPGMPDRIVGAATTTAHGALYLLAPGRSEVSCFVLRDDAWATAAILDAPVAEPAIAMLPDDDLVVMDRASGRLERVRLRTGEASRLPSLPAAGCGFAALDGTLYVVGGTQGRADLDGVWAMTIVDRLRVFRQLPRALAHAREGAHDTPLRGR